MWRIKKTVDNYLDTMIHITLTNIITGQHSTTTCSKENYSNTISEMKKNLLHR